MLLGELLANLDEKGVAEELLLSIGDPVLMAHAHERAAATGQPLGDFLLEEVGSFSNTASSDDWLSLMTAASRSDNPGGACLASVLRFSLQHRDCACDGGNLHV